MRVKQPDVRLTWDEYQQLMRAAGLSAGKSGIDDVISLLRLYSQLQGAVDKQAREAWVQAIEEFKEKKNA